MRHFSFLTSLVFISLLVTGCSSLQKPTATFKNMSVQDVNVKGFTMNFDIDVNNPNAVSMPLSNADYEIALGSIKVLEGKAKPADAIPANGTVNMKLPVTLTYENLYAAEEAIRKGGGDVPYALTGGLSFSSDNPLALGQAIRVPLNYSGTLQLKQLLKDPMLLLQSPAARELAQKVLGQIFSK